MRIAAHKVHLIRLDDTLDLPMDGPLHQLTGVPVGLGGRDRRHLGVKARQVVPLKRNKICKVPGRKRRVKGPGRVGRGCDQNIVQRHRQMPVDPCPFGFALVGHKGFR